MPGVFAVGESHSGSQSTGRTLQLAPALSPSGSIHGYLEELSVEHEEPTQLKIGRRSSQCPFVMPPSPTRPGRSDPIEGETDDVGWAEPTPDVHRIVVGVVPQDRSGLLLGSLAERLVRQVVPVDPAPTVPRSAWAAPRAPRPGPGPVSADSTTASASRKYARLARSWVCWERAIPSLEVGPGGRVVAQGDGCLGQVVQGNVGRQPVPARSGQLESPFDLRSTALGGSLRRSRMVPSQTWTSERSQIAVLAGLLPRGEAPRGSTCSAASSSPAPSAASPVPARPGAGDLRILLFGAEAEGLLPVRRRWRRRSPPAYDIVAAARWTRAQDRRATGRRSGTALARRRPTDGLAAQPPVQPHRPGDPARGLTVAAVERAVDGHQDVGLVGLDPVSARATWSAPS